MESRDRAGAIEYSEIKEETFRSEIDETRREKTRRHSLDGVENKY